MEENKLDVLYNKFREDIDNVSQDYIEEVISLEDATEAYGKVLEQMKKDVDKAFDAMED